MLLQSNVVFDYTIKKGNLCKNGTLPRSEMYRLFSIVHDALNTDSVELILNRTVQIVKYTQIAGQAPIVMDVDKETLKIIAANKLVYPYQVREMLMKKYNNTFNFDELNLSENIPVYFGGVLEREELGPTNPNTGDKTTYTRRYVECRTLTDEDIVVDKNNSLRQIWPVKSDYPPSEMVKILSKTKETIY